MFNPLIKNVLGVTTPTQHYFMARLTDGRMVRIEERPHPEDRPQRGDFYFEAEAEQQTA